MVTSCCKLLLMVLHVRAVSGTLLNMDTCPFIVTNIATPLGSPIVKLFWHAYKMNEVVELIAWVTGQSATAGY